MADVIDNSAKQPSSGTGFTNLSRVLNANQNNRLGNTIGSGVSNVVGQAKSNLGQAQQQFGQQSQKGAVGSDQDKQYVQQTLQDPTKAQQSDYDKFSRFRQGYQGPQGLQSDTLKAQQQDLSSLGGLANSSGGRQALLQRFVGGPQYNQGQQQLDTMLLGQSGGNLNNLRRQTQQANQNINQGYDVAAQQANLLKNQSAGFGQDVTNQLTGAQTAQNTDLTNRAAQYTTEEQALHDTLANLLTPVKDVATPSNGQVGIGLANQQTGPGAINQAQYDQAMAALGRAGQSGQDLLNQQLYGANAVNGFDPNSVIGNVNAYTTNQVANAQDLAKAQALAKLSGDQTPTGLAAATADQLGGYDPLSFLNQGNLKNYEQQGKTIYDQAGNKIKSGNEYIADINRVDAIKKQQEALLNSANTQTSNPSGEGYTVGMSPEQQAQYDALQTERSNLANKQSLMSAYNVMANYAGGDPYMESMYQQAMQPRIGNANQDIKTANEQQQKYNQSTISDRLKALINGGAKTDQYGNTIQG
jgi:hypothetical protein